MTTFNHPNGTPAMHIIPQYLHVHIDRLSITLECIKQSANEDKAFYWIIQ